MKTKLLLLLLLLVFMNGCKNSLLVTSSGVLQQAGKSYRLMNGKREVIYIPMHHLGTRSYYEYIQRKVDSLQKNGFVVYYESIAYQTDSEEQRDLYDRKFRKLTANRLGLQQCIEIYTAPSDTTKALRAPQYRKLGDRIIPQPDYNFFLIDPQTAVKADIPKNKLIDDFEYVYGDIVLTECDFKTLLQQEYHCKPASFKLKKKFDTEFIMGAREKNLASLVDDAPVDKILILFGGSHFKGFLRNLQSRDPNWIRVKNTL